MSLAAYLDELKKTINDRLKKLVPEPDTHPAILHEAINYSLFSGGKRLRPILAIAACDAVKGNRENVFPFATALELVHTYTLIHDDLPALDDDDLRRGRPTCHKKFGDANAILAGDALLTMAFEIITNRNLYDDIDPDRLLTVATQLGAAIGSEGTIGGQVVDLMMEDGDPDMAALEYIHTHKTGKLIAVSIAGGALLAGGSDEQIKALTDYGKNIGLAFQIADDILDIEGDEKELGKTLGSDIDNKKLTYPALLGMKESKDLAARLVVRAIDKLDIFGEKGKRLEEIARFIVDRKS